MRENGNNGRRRRAVISVAAAAMLAVTAFAFLTDTDANERNEAALGAAAGVAITGSMTETHIESIIQTAIGSVAGGGTVTVTGQKTDVTEGIDLLIPIGVTVVWKAVYEGTIDTGNYYDNYLISLSGGGTFNVADGGDLTATIPDIGGSVLVAGGNYAFVSGGTVSVFGDNTYAVYTNPGTVTVTGGTVSAFGEYGIALYTEHGNIVMSGGTVTAAGDSCMTLAAHDGNIMMSGGNVTADICGGAAYTHAVYVSNGGYAAIRGGSVSAFDSASGGSADIWGIYIRNASAAAYLTGTCTGGGIYNDSSCWVTEVSPGWTGTNGIELSISPTSGFSGVEWVSEPYALKIADDILRSITLTWNKAVLDAGDIAVVEQMINNNGLALPKSPDGADHTWMMSNWPCVNWDGTYPVLRMTMLDVSNGGLTGALDVSGLTVLERLNCDHNNLTALDISGLTALERLECGYNSLAALDVSGLAALEYLGCYGNYLTALDVSANVKLETLECGGNSLTELTAAGLPVLNNISCNINELAGLDVTGCSALYILDVRNNRMGSTDDVVSGGAPFAPAANWDVMPPALLFSPQRTDVPVGLSEDVCIPAGDGGTDVNVDIGAFITGGTGPYAFVKISGPDWLEIDGSTGIITGTRPATAQTETKMIIGVGNSDTVVSHGTIVIIVGAVTEVPGPGNDTENDTDNNAGGTGGGTGGSNVMLVIALVLIAAIAVAAAVYMFVLYPKK